MEFSTNSLRGFEGGLHRNWWWRQNFYL